MVRLPIVAENWLDGDQAPDDQTLAPPDSGGAGSGGPTNPIGPVQGYPEDGKHAWRAANDDVIVEAVQKHNEQNNRLPGDVDYMTPGLMKAWMMRESGGNPDAFKTDPFQVNKAGDWPKDNAKAKIAGLSKDQAMNPQTSADAALNWLQYKGTIHDTDGKPVGYRGHYEALARYNAAKGVINGVPAPADYANSVMNNAWASYGDWQE